MATTPIKPAAKSNPITTKPVTPAPAKTTPATVKKPEVKATVIAKTPVAAKTKAVEAAAKKGEKEKTPKLKMERDSFTMPKAEYAQIYILKDKLVKLGQPAKKSELLRAGLMLLSAMDDEKLKATMAKIPAIKTGRPKK